MAIKTHKVTLSLDNPRVIQSGINVQSFDKQSIQISIELTKNDEVFQVPSDATIRISLLKLARQEQKIIVDVPNTNRESIDWIVPDYLDGYQGVVRVGVYLVSGAENVDLGYFTILSNVSDIDKMADEFVDNVFQGWEQIEADLNELKLTIAQTKLDLADDLTQIDSTIAQVNTLASDFTTDVATKQTDVTSKYNAFDTSVTTANQTIDDILALQPQFQAVLDETTGKDVISAPEIILARGGATTLGERLNEEKAEVTAQLAQKASKDELNALGELKLAGEYATLTELQNAYPTGSDGVFLVIADGFVYRWDGTNWIQSVQFQSTGIALKSVTIEKLGGFDDVIVPKTLTKDTGDYTNSVSVTNNALKGWALPFTVSEFSGKITKISAYLSIPSESNIEVGIANRVNSASNILFTQTKTLASSGEIEFDIDFDTDEIVGVGEKFFLWFKNLSGKGLRLSNAIKKDYPTLNDNEFYYWSGTQWDASTNFATYGIADIKIYTDYTFDYSRKIHTHKASDIIDLDVINNVEISFPRKYDLVVGDTFEMYWKGVLLSNDPYRYNYVVTCDKGNVYKRKFRYTPTVSDVGTHTFGLSVYDDQKRLLDSKSVELVVNQKATSPTEKKNVLCLGDSLMAGGTWVNEVSRRLTGVGGTPSGDNISNVNFVGTKSTKMGVGYEGAGGWTYGNYTTNTATDSIKWVNVTSHDKTTSDESSLYEDGNGSQWSIETIETGRIKMVRESSSGTLPTSGSLTWISGGDNHADINYNSVTAESANPFWNESTNKVDFVNYASEQGVSGIDICYVLLGWNMTNLNEATFKQNARSFIDKLRADYPSCKISLLGLQVPSLDGIGANYGTAWNYYEKLQFVFNLNDWYKDISAEYTDVDVINIAGQFDTDYNMQTTTRAINTRNSTLETYQNNGVHPAEEGYLQIADAVYRNITGKL